MRSFRSPELAFVRKFLNIEMLILVFMSFFLSFFTLLLTNLLTDHIGKFFVVKQFSERIFPKTVHRADS